MIPGKIKPGDVLVFISDFPVHIPIWGDETIAKIKARDKDPYEGWKSPEKINPWNQFMVVEVIISGSKLNMSSGLTDGHFFNKGIVILKVLTALNQMGIIAVSKKTTRNLLVKVTKRSVGKLAAIKAAQIAKIAEIAATQQQQQT